MIAVALAASACGDAGEGGSGGDDATGAGGGDVTTTASGTAAPVEPVTLPMNAYCDAWPTIDPSQNPPLDEALPGTRWDLGSACLSQSLYGEPHIFVPVALEGTATVQWIFSDEQTVALVEHFVYRETIDVAVETFAAYDLDCAGIAQYIMGIHPDAWSLPAHQGFVYETSSCVELDAVTCRCDLDTDVLFAEDGAAYGVSDDRRYLSLPGGLDAMQLQGETISALLSDGGSSGQVSSPLAAITLHETR